MGYHRNAWSGWYAAINSAIDEMMPARAEVFLGIDAEGRSLEDVARPLSVVPEPAAA